MMINRRFQIEQPLKENWKSYRTILRRREINRLFHVTERKNWKSILKNGGIFSRSGQRKLDIFPASLNGWGGNADIFSDYICLGLKPPYGMIRKMKAPVILIIDPAVIYRQGTVFCPVNSAQKGLNPAVVVSRFTPADFEALFKSDYGDFLINRDSEILVRDRIPLRDITAVVCREKSDYRNLNTISWIHSLTRFRKVPPLRVAEKDEKLFPRTKELVKYYPPRPKERG